MVIDAVREASGCEPVVLPRLGGSTPDYLLNKELGLPSIWVPYANADENNHAPNENIAVADFMEGIRTTATIHTASEILKDKTSSGIMVVVSPGNEVKR